MTAGRGIVHQEYHSKEFTRTGGTFEVCFYDLSVLFFRGLALVDSTTPPNFSSFCLDVSIVGQSTKEAQNDETWLPSD